MGWFSKDNIDDQYKKVSGATLDQLNDEFLAGFQYGTQEYSGSWEGKNWKDDLEKFAKALQKYDRISFIADAKNLGIHLGKLNAMLKSDLIYTILQDDKASGIILEILERLKALKEFNMNTIRKNVNKIKLKKLNDSGLANIRKMVTFFETH